MARPVHQTFYEGEKREGHRRGGIRLCQAERVAISTPYWILHHHYAAAIIHNWIALAT